MNRLLILLVILLTGCSQYREYSSITIYDPIENSDDCESIKVEIEGKIIINTARKFIKANVFGEEKKFKIESYKYGYNPFNFAIFGREKTAKSITIICNNGYRFYIEYGMFCILTIPDDGDEDICDDKIFYDL